MWTYSYLSPASALSNEVYYVQVHFQKGTQDCHQCGLAMTNDGDSFIPIPKSIHS